MKQRVRLAFLLLAALATAPAATAYEIDRAIGAYTFRQAAGDGYESGFVEFKNDHTFVLVVHTDEDFDGIAERYAVTRGEYFVKKNEAGEPGIFVVPEGGEGAFLVDPRSDGEILQSFCWGGRCFTRKGARQGYFEAGAGKPSEAGSVHIETAPAGAVVYVDGERKPGNTPLTVEGIAAGVAHSVRLEYAGFQPLVRTVTLQPNQTQRLVVKLPTGKEPVLIRSIPVVDVWIDDRMVGRTPVEGMELAPGSYRVTLRNEGAGIEKSFQLDIEEGEPYERTFKFFGRLSVDVGRPCRVFAGRVDLGTAPLSGARVPAGIHRVRLEPEGGKPIFVNVRIAVDTESRIGGTLDYPVVEGPEM